MLSMLFPISGVKDYTCGYRAYKAGLLKNAFGRWGNDFIEESGFSCMVDILLKLREIGIIATEVPLILRYDLKPGASKMNVRKNIIGTFQLILKRKFGRR